MCGCCNNSSGGRAVVGRRRGALCVCACDKSYLPFNRTSFTSIDIRDSTSTTNTALLFLPSCTRCAQRPFLCRSTAPQTWTFALVLPVPYCAHKPLISAPQPRHVGRGCPLRAGDKGGCALLAQQSRHRKPFAFSASQATPYARSSSVPSVCAGGAGAQVRDGVAGYGTTRQRRACPIDIDAQTLRTFLA
jgi:hypothetical protein